MDEPTLRACRGCAVTKPIDQFYRTSSGGLRGKCKECVRAQVREYHHANRERRLAQHAAWAEQNREAIRERARQYYAENREVHRLRSLKWSRENPEYYREYNAAWYAEHSVERRRQIKEYRDARPEWVAEMNRAQAARYLARKANAFTIPFTLDQLASRLAFYGNVCWICREAPGVEIDHVKPLSRGGPHILANLRPACRPCNASKNARWPFVREEAA